MKKILVIGCPGAGKSTFSRKLKTLTGIPLYHLDLIFHRADKTTVSAEEFDSKLSEILAKDTWIIDGNYDRTLPVRLSQCDTVFWLDYPLDICLAGIEARRGQPREDMPWIETEPDYEFLEYVKNFKRDKHPIIEKLLSTAIDKNIYIFKTREEAGQFLEKYEIWEIECERRST